MRTKILVGLMFFSLLVPVITKAEIIPEMNPLCWKHKDCDDVRAKFSPTKGDGGWFQETPCTGDWGKCLPVGKTKTEIAFGGKKEFSNIGDFLKTNYDIAITIAGILAVIMIIVAGVQWVASGGNSEMITSAKKRIGGSLTGLLIAYLSYTILNTINPAMVNLRLPQTFMIRQINAVIGNYCVDLEKLWKVAPVASEKDTPKDSDWIDPFVELEVKDLCKNETSISKSLNPLRDDKTKCGQKYLIKDGGGTTCMGSICDQKTDVCDHDKCTVFGDGQTGGIGGKIKFSNEQNLENIWLYAACGPNSFEVGYKDTAASDNNFLFSSDIVQKAAAAVACGSEDKIDGFFFALEIKDFSNLNDIWYGGTSFCSNITAAPSCGFIGANSRKEGYRDLATLSFGTHGQLIPYENAKKGFLCNLDLGSDAMPEVGVGFFEGFGKEIIKSAFPKLPDAAIDQFSNKNVLVSGYSGSFNCPAYDRAESMFQTKLKKVKCKCNPDKCQ